MTKIHPDNQPNEEFFNDETHCDNGDIVTLTARQLPGSDIVIHETVYDTHEDETYKQKRVIATNHIRISCDQLVEIIESLHGKLIGKFSGVPLIYNQAREQLYAEIRERFGTLRKIAESDDGARDAFRSMLVESDDDQKAVHLIRLMALILTSEIIERFKP